MSTEVQMSIKVERELRDQFAAAAAEMQRPASQMIREFMWSVVDRNHEPNEETIAAMDELDNGGGVRFNNIEDLFRDLGIPCEK